MSVPRPSLCTRLPLKAPICVHPVCGRRQCLFASAIWARDWCPETTPELGGLPCRHIQNAKDSISLVYEEPETANCGLPVRFRELRAAARRRIKILVGRRSQQAAGLFRESAAYGESGAQSDLRRKMVFRCRQLRELKRSPDHTESQQARC